MFAEPIKRIATAALLIDHLSKEHADSIEYVTLAQLARRLQNHGSWHAEDANGAPGSQS